MTCAPTLVLAGLLALAMPLAGQSSPLFGLPDTLGAGTNPSSVVIGDFNGDGHRDLAVSNEGDSTLSVMLGTASGMFTAADTYLTGLGPRALALGDLDLDGATDLVTADHAGHTVSVMLGRGDGTFVLPASYPIGLFPNSVCVADVTDDGWLDVVACCGGTASHPIPAIFVLHGLGGGLLGATPGFYSGLLTSHAAVAQLDGDGEPDLVTCNAGDGTFFVWLNHDGGTFVLTDSYQIDGPKAALPVDVGGDGALDLAVSFESSALPLYGGAGNGSFHGPVGILLDGGAAGTAAADLNDDGRQDVVATLASRSMLQAMFGQEGNLLSAAKGYDTGAAPGAVALGDLDGDGWPDAVTVLPAAGGVAVLRNLRPVDPWTDLGFSMPAHGGPVLMAAGTLRPESAGVISLSNAPPHAPALIVMSTSLGLAGFACGALMTVPVERQWVVSTGAAGDYQAFWANWPAAMALEDFVLQAAIVDAQAPCGFALSNGLKALLPE